MARFDKKLATMLTRRGLIPSEQEEALLSKAEAEDVSLGTILLQDKIVDEETMIGCMSEEMKLPPINLSKVHIDPEVLDIVTEEVAKQYGVLPIARIGKHLTLAVANPFDVLALDDVKIITGHSLMPVVSTEPAIQEAIQRAYHRQELEMESIFQDIEGLDPDMKLTESTEDEVTDLADLSNEGSPVVKLVNLIVFNAIKAGASDIHLEPYEKRMRLRYRIDGVCSEQAPPPKQLQNAITSRLKIMSEMDIAERRRPQDGKFQMKVQGRQVDFRVSVLPMVHGEKTVIRILDTSSLALSLDSLGFEEKALADFQKAIVSAYGMILVTGPTGSGKSTTLYSAIKEVMSVEDNITTVEDPVEYQLEGVNQVPVNDKRGLTFAAALRSILRQDPDTVMIGEIRDLETAEIAVKAALTGHLVLSTLHTNDAPSTVSRMVDMGIDPFMVSASTLLVSAQRLVRRLCQSCKQEHEVPEERMKKVGFLPEEIGTEKVYQRNESGCSICSHGYKGRMALLETMPISDGIRRIVIDGGSALDLKQQALEEDMLTLRRAGLLNVLRGKTSIEEVLAITMADE